MYVCECVDGYLFVRCQTTINFRRMGSFAGKKSDKWEYCGQTFFFRACLSQPHDPVSLVFVKGDSIKAGEKITGMQLENRMSELVDAFPFATSRASLFQSHHLVDSAACCVK